MNIEEIQKNKPDGATHISTELGVVYYFYNDGEDWYIFEDGIWIPTCCDDDIKPL